MYINFCYLKTLPFSRELLRRFNEELTRPFCVRKTRTLYKQFYLQFFVFFRKRNGNIFTGLAKVEIKFLCLKNIMLPILLHHAKEGYPTDILLTVIAFLSSALIIACCIYMYVHRTYLPFQVKQIPLTLISALAGVEWMITSPVSCSLPVIYLNVLDFVKYVF
jgi:hypothetical protein